MALSFRPAEPRSRTRSHPRRQVCRGKTCLLCGEEAKTTLSLQRFNDVCTSIKTIAHSHNHLSAYHAQSQSALERFHLTLKSLPRASSADTERRGSHSCCWLPDRPWQESTGLSANELVFGHSVRGTLSVLKDGCKLSHH